MTAALKQRKCRVCKERFPPWNSMQICCSLQCAAKYSAEQVAKAQRKRTREDKQRIKTRSQWLKEAQQAFNAYIRERDKDQPCISCGAFNVEHTRGGGWDCGHYRSTGACPELRFEELNAHKQCKQCNSYLSGNTVEYRIRLRMRIGDQRVEWLESKHEPKKYTIDDLKEIKKHYQKKKRELSGKLPGKASRKIPKSRSR